MRFIETPLKDAFLVESEAIVDERGIFARIFCSKEYSGIGFDGQMVQTNYSLTRKRGTIRGMHYQIPPVGEQKLIRCVQGKVFDVVVDLRMGSPTFMGWFGTELSEENMRMVFIPKGFAHGFQSLTDHAALIYHHSAIFTPEHERGLRYDDPAMSIQWPLPVSVISLKDQTYPLMGASFEGIKA